MKSEGNTGEIVDGTSSPHTEFECGLSVVHEPHIQTVPIAFTLLPVRLPHHDMIHSAEIAGSQILFFQAAFI